MNDNPIYHLFNYLYPNCCYPRHCGQLQIIKHGPGAAGAFTMEGNIMNNIFGITGIQVFMTSDLGELNRFLEEYDGNIIDVQCTDKYFHVVFRMKEYE